MFACKTPQEHDVSVRSCTVWYQNKPLWPLQTWHSRCLQQTDPLPGNAVQLLLLPFCLAVRRFGNRQTLTIKKYQHLLCNLFLSEESFFKLYLTVPGRWSRRLEPGSHTGSEHRWPAAPPAGCWTPLALDCPGPTGSPWTIRRTASDQSCDILGQQSQ